MRGANRYYYTADSLGSITGVLDQAGTRIETNTYRAFGENVLSSPTLNQPFGYTGREYDSETGLYYYRARYYEPKFGRFISEDPIRFEGGMNFYAYVDNNPTTNTDPFGLDWLLTAAEFSHSAGKTLSLGITGWINDATGASALLSTCSDAYKWGGRVGTGVSLAFGAAHLGRNAVLQAGQSGLGQGLRRLAFDDRTWGAVRSQWSKGAARDGQTTFLKPAGQHLNHWLFPQRAANFGVPRGLLNAGFNYLPMSARLNSWMNGATPLSLAAEWALKGTIFGIYGGLGGPR